MGNPSKRLPRFSANDPFQPFALNNDQWGELDKIYAGKLPPELRTVLNGFCNSYLMARDAELNAGSASSALKIAELGRKRVSEFTLVARSLLRDGGDAGSYASSVVRKLLEKEVVRLDPTQLRTCTPQSSGWEPIFIEDPGFQIRLELSEQFLADFANGLVFVFSQAVKEIEISSKVGPGFDPGMAIKELINRVGDVLASISLSISAKSGGAPSKFARFLFSLHQMLPEERREKQMASAEAMAQRIRAVRKRG